MVDYGRVQSHAVAVERHALANRIHAGVAHAITCIRAIADRALGCVGGGVDTQRRRHSARDGTAPVALRAAHAFRLGTRDNDEQALTLSHGHRCTH